MPDRAPPNWSGWLPPPKGETLAGPLFVSVRRAQLPRSSHARAILELDRATRSFVGDCLRGDEHARARARNRSERCARANRRRTSIRRTGARRARLRRAVVRRRTADRWNERRANAAPPEYLRRSSTCLLYTSDAADERSSVALGG